MKKVSPAFWLGLLTATTGVYIVFREWAWIGKSEVATVIMVAGIGLILSGFSVISLVMKGTE